MTWASAWVGHLVGDFLFQNDWMARRKGVNPLPGSRMVWWVLVLHGVIAGGMAAIFAGWGDWRGLASIGAHIFIDATRIGKRWPKWVNQSADWLGLIDDQVLHVVSLWLISSWRGR